MPVVAGDAVTGTGLDEALDGIDVAYFLIHSMEPAPGSGDGFGVREHAAAERFAGAARRAGVGRIVYLGGPEPPRGVGGTCRRTWPVAWRSSGYCSTACPGRSRCALRS